MAIRKIVSRSISDTTNIGSSDLDTTGAGGTGASILAKGTTAQRPGSPVEGMLRYNTTTGLYEQYSAIGWQAIDAPPTVSSISPITYNGEAGTTITITGTNFKTGAVVKFVTSAGSEYNASTTTFVSSTSLTATTPQDFTVADEPLDIKVVNPSGLSGVLENALDCGGSPSFNTASGSLGTIYDSIRSSYTLTSVSATDPDTSATITYSITSGALPTGMSLNSSTCAITGTPNAVGSDTTSSFTITATDNAGNATSRAFSILVKAPVITSYTTVGSGTFSVPSGISSVQVLVVAGGGAGANGNGASGGGGAGGMIEMSSFPVTPGGTVSYTVGAGGSPGTPGSDISGLPGNNSVFGTLTAIGGGGGGGWSAPTAEKSRPGGSGGGGGATAVGGTATQPSQPGNSGTYGYGYPGGTGTWPTGPGGGGGGAGAAGKGVGNGPQGVGGAGRSSSITGSAVTYAGGGGGGSEIPIAAGASGGAGGGGSGANNPAGGYPSYTGQAGGTNLGGGGGAGTWSPGPTVYTGGAGGPGVVIIKY